VTNNIPRAAAAGLGTRTARALRKICIQISSVAKWAGFGGQYFLQRLWAICWPESDLLSYRTIPMRFFGKFRSMMNFFQLLRPLGQ
jgi:hypothetical protein